MMNIRLKRGIYIIAKKQGLIVEIDLDVHNEGFGSVLFPTFAA